jgi:hypothetical protein
MCKVNNHIIHILENKQKKSPAISSWYNIHLPCCQLYFCSLSLILFCFSFFETVPASVELILLLPQPPACCDYRRVPVVSFCVCVVLLLLDSFAPYNFKHRLFFLDFYQKELVCHYSIAFPLFFVMNASKNLYYSSI